jgi:hypothetical protein
MIDSGSKVDLTKKLYDKKAYLNVIDTQFNELLQPTSPTEPEVSIDEFFQLYNDLFYDIPKFGETNSHEYLIKQSSDYVGSAILTDDIQALLDEITSLREENLELQRNIIDLTTNTNS